MIAVDAARERDLGAVREGEERIRGEYRPRRGRARTLRLLDAICTASTRLCCPAPIPIVCRSFAITIAFDERACTRATRTAGRPTAPRSTEPETTLHAVALLDVPVAVLDEQPAEDALVVELVRRDARRSRSTRMRACRLRRPARRAPRVVIRARSSTSTNCSRDAARRAPRHRPVDRADLPNAESGSDGERALVRLLDRRRRPRRRTGSRA